MGRKLGRYEREGVLDVDELCTEYGATIEFQGSDGYKRKLSFKQLHPHVAGDDELRELALRGARAIASVSHPDVEQIFEVGLYDEGSWGLFCEYSYGLSLRRLTRRSALAFGATCAIEVAYEAAQGLQYVQRSLKASGEPPALGCLTPASLCVLDYSGVKLIDAWSYLLWRALWRRPEYPFFNRVRCSYMAPEQVAGGPPDPRWDVFSLGVILWEMLSGRPLFRGETLDESRRKVERCELPSFKASCPGCPGPLYDVLHDALARSPHHRIQNAGVLSHRLLPIFKRLLGQAPPGELSPVHMLLKDKFSAEMAALEDKVYEVWAIPREGQ